MDTNNIPLLPTLLYDVTTTKKQVYGLGNIFNAVPKLTPKTAGGLIDIVNNFKWKNSGNAAEVPRIFARELELQYGMWTQNFAKALTLVENIFTGSQIDAYLQLYASQPTGFNYSFPWLLKDGENIRSISNSWDKVEGLPGLLKKVSEKATTGSILGAGAAAGFGSMSPGIGFEEINEFKQTEKQEITISFPLYNTTTIIDAFNNYAFVSMFTFQNLKTRTSFMTFIPPKLYTLDSKNLGGLYWPLAYVSNFKIDSIGTTRDISSYMEITNGNNILVPEAYKVTITFKELVSQSSNIFAGTMGGQKVVISGMNDMNKITNQFQQQVANPVATAGQYTKNTLNTGITYIKDNVEFANKTPTGSTPVDYSKQSPILNEPTFQQGKIAPNTGGVVIQNPFNPSKTFSIPPPA